MVNAARTFVFDAVGTLIRPLDSISETYRMAAKTWGLALPRSEVRDRFKAHRNHLFNNSPIQPSSNELEKQCWRELVADVFYELPDTAGLFQQLWEHYAQPQHWILFADVEACLRSCEQLGHTIIIASNFDNRLIPICKQLLPGIKSEQIYCSGDLGFRKPDLRFYQEIERQRGNLLSRPLMIGDDLEKDVLAAQKAGWEAVHLNRKAHSLTDVMSRVL